MVTLEPAAPVELAHQRMRDAYLPGSLTDGRKLGLAIGSGGMAGIVTLGKLQSIRQSGIRAVVDGVYGDSIGGINAAIDAAEQIDEAREAYYALAKRRFIDGWRALRIGGRAVDMGILEHEMRYTTILDTEKVTNSPIPISIGVTRLRNYAAMSVDLTHIEPEEVIPWLLRGAHLPIAGGAAPRDKFGTPYADAGLSSMSPVHRAVKDGCTDVIFLSNQPYARDEKRNWQVGVVGMWAMRHDLQAIFKFNNVVNHQIESRKPFCEGAFRYGAANVMGYYPQAISGTDALPTLYTMDPGRLKAGFEVAALMMMSRLSPVLAV